AATVGVEDVHIGDLARRRVVRARARRDRERPDGLCDDLEQTGLHHPDLPRDRDIRCTRGHAPDERQRGRSEQAATLCESHTIPLHLAVVAFDETSATFCHYSVAYCAG